MFGTTRSPLQRYGVALGVSLAAFLLTLVFRPLLAPTPYMLFFGAVVISAWYGGLKPGLLATVVSAVATQLVFLPHLSVIFPTWSDVIRIAMFVGVAALISSLQSATRAAEWSALEERERLRVTLASIGDAVIATDRDGKITFLNTAAESATGWTRQEAVGRPLSQVFRILDEKTRQTVERPLTKVLREGSVVGLANHTLLLRRDGVEIPIDDSGAPVRSASGAIAGVVLVFRDVTEKRKAEEERRAGQDRLRLAMEAARMGSFEWNIQTGALSWSENLALLHGLKPEAFGGSFEAFVETIHPEDRESVSQAITRSLEEGGAYESEFRSLWPDGSFHWVMGKGQVFRDERGKPLRMAGVCIDITERKRAEHERAELLAREQAARQETEGALHRHRELEQRLSALVEASAALLGSPKLEDVFAAILRVAGRLIPAGAYAVWRSDPATGTWRVARSMGLSEEYQRETIQTMTGQAIPDQPLALEDLEQEPMIAPRLELYRKEGIRSILAVPLRIAGTRSGTVTFYYHQPHHFSDTEIRVAAALANLSSSAINIADLYEDQRRLRGEAEVAERRSSFLAEAGAALASSLDYQATLAELAKLAVPQFADWCIIDLVEEGSGLRRVAVVHSDPEKVQFANDLQERYPPDPNAPHGVYRVLRTGEPDFAEDIDDALLASVAVNDEHLAILRGLGLRSFISAPLTARDRTVGVVTFVTAESGRRYTQEDVEFAQEICRRAGLAVDNARLYRDAQEANRTKDEFLATISHELRTPLTAMLGWARLLRTGEMDKEQTARALETIERNAKAQAQLVEDLLDVSRIISGKLRLDVRAVDPAQVIEAAVDSVRLAAETKAVKLQTVLDPRAGPVFGDPDRLRQVFWNLLSNAVKFTPKGGRVQVRLARVNSHVEVTVSDTGRGIRLEFLPYVFERFRQADSSTTRTHGGLGLGLAIVRHLVELHGGSVSVDSEGDGKGATFSVFLPLMVVAHPQMVIAADRVHPTVGDGPEFECPPSLQDLQVLIVDDEADTRDLLSAVLSKCGARVTAVGSSAEALDVLDRSRPQVLLSDIEMPGEDGYLLIQKIRARSEQMGGRIPAAALTAYARVEDRVRALSAGFQIHIPKPVEPAELVAVVANLARLHTGP